MAGRFGFSSDPNSTCTASGVASTTQTQPTVQLSVTGAGTSTLEITATVVSGTTPANQLTIYDDDQAIATPTINGSTTYSFSYNPATDGSHTIKAVVSDSSGNTGQNSYTVTVAGTGSSTTTTPSGQ